MLTSRRPTIATTRSLSRDPERLIDHPLIRALILALFAVAMGHLEAVVVYYIRLDLGDVHGTGSVPQEVLRAFPWGIEATREVATLAMLGTIAVLAGRNWSTQLSALLWTFAVWDATYYASLRILTGWPRSLLSPDTYFLLPVPWGGPVWVPLAADVVLAAAAAVLVLKGLRSSGSPGAA
jgi:hypothetical protein